MGVEQLPLLGRARCDMLAFGVEAGTQSTLDRLRKRQTLAQVEHAVGEAKKHGIDRVHGFFVIGCPGETAEDIRETFRFAARLEIDTFAPGVCCGRSASTWRGGTSSGCSPVRSAPEQDRSRPAGADGGCGAAGAPENSERLRKEWVSRRRGPETRNPVVPKDPQGFLSRGDRI